MPCQRREDFLTSNPIPSPKDAFANHGDMRWPERRQSGRDCVWTSDDRGQPQVLSEVGTRWRGDASCDLILGTSETKKVMTSVSCVIPDVILEALPLPGSMSGWVGQWGGRTHTIDSRIRAWRPA